MAKKRVAHVVDPAEIEKNAAGTPQYAFASTLNHLMEKMGIDQEKMSEDLGLSTGIIHNYRHGKTEPKLSAITKIAGYLHVDCHYLLTGVRSENSAVAEETGLSEESIDFLRGSNREYGGSSPEVDALNDLLRDSQVRDLLTQISVFKKVKQENAKEIELCRNITAEVRDGIAGGVPDDILVGRVSIPLYRLEAIEPGERYQRFLALDSFTKLFDSVYSFNDFAMVNGMLKESLALRDSLSLAPRDS